MSPCDLRKNVSSELLSHRLQLPPRAPPTVPSILQAQLITTMYIKLQMIINHNFFCFTHMHRHYFIHDSREMQEIFRHALNNKRQYFIEPFLIRSVRCKHEHFWLWFLSSPLVLSHLSTAVVVFFVWQWQQVCNQISNLRLYYIDSGTQHHNKMIFAPYVAKSALVWMGSSSFVLLPA